MIAAEALIQNAISDSDFRNFSELKVAPNCVYLRLWYIGIRRSDCEACLKNQEAYQIRQTPSHRTNRPIVANYRNQRICWTCLASPPIASSTFSSVSTRSVARCGWRSCDAHPRRKLAPPFMPSSEGPGSHPTSRCVTTAASSTESSRNFATKDTLRSSPVDPIRLCQAKS